MDHECQGLGPWSSNIGLKFRNLCLKTYSAFSLPYWSTFMTPSGAYRHAHVAQGSFFHRRMPCVMTVVSQEPGRRSFLTNQRASRRRVWSVLMTQSAHMFGLSWEQKPRRGRIFSRPGQDLTPRKNFWQIPKTRLPRPLTSPIASLAIRNHCNMHPHHWTLVFGIGLHLSPSDMKPLSGNIQGYNNEIQIAGSDAAIGHNPGINEAEPIASNGD